jgi:hypothetical protein
MSSLIVEEWRDLWSFKAEFMLVGLSYVFATTNFLNLPRLVLDNGGCEFTLLSSLKETLPNQYNIKCHQFQWPFSPLMVLHC